MTNPRFIRISVILVIATAAAMASSWYFGHRPIAYHNERIRSAIGYATELEISLPPQIGAGGKLDEVKPLARITDRNEIDRVLNKFILPWNERSSGLFHECGGHLTIRIGMPDATGHVIRFDHGVGIYPIDQDGRNPGFSKLPDSACSQLVDYFISIGYSRQDLGMP